MPMTHLPKIKIGAKNRYRFSDASDVQFGTEFFWYQFLVTNMTCSIFVPVYGSSLSRVFGDDFWYVCLGHNAGGVQAAVMLVR